MTRWQIPNAAETEATLNELADAYLGRRLSPNAPHVGFTVHPIPGRFDVRTDHVEVGRRGTLGWRRYVHVLTVDLGAIARAWASVGTPALGDAIVVAAEQLRAEENGVGPVYRFTGIQRTAAHERSSKPPELHVFEHYVAQAGPFRTSGFWLDGVIRQARALVDRYEDVDWSDEDVWCRPTAMRVHSITDAEVDGEDLLVHGFRPTQPAWTDTGQLVDRPGTDRIRVMEDGRRMLMGWGGLGPTPEADWLEFRTMRSFPRTDPIPDEDMTILEGM